LADVRSTGADLCHERFSKADGVGKSRQGAPGETAGMPPKRRSIGAAQHFWFFMRANARGPAHHSLREHGAERVVAAPEMVEERRRGMQRNQAEEKEPERLVDLH
jgi:hypothetical protein